MDQIMLPTLQDGLWRVAVSRRFIDPVECPCDRLLPARIERSPTRRAHRRAECFVALPQRPHFFPSVPESDGQSGGERRAQKKRGGVGSNIPTMFTA